MKLDEFHARFELGRDGRARPKAGGKLPASVFPAPAPAGSGSGGVALPHVAKEAVLPEGVNAARTGAKHGPRKDGNACNLPAELPPLPHRRGGRNHEALLQRRIVMALRQDGYAALAVNGEVGLSGRLGMLLQMIRKALGYEPGTPEVIVALPKGRTLWLEVKLPPDGQGVMARIRAPRRGGRLSEQQKRIHELLRGLEHRVATVRSESEAIEVAELLRREAARCRS